MTNPKPATFRETILAHYIDDEGLVTKDRSPTKWSTGNGLLFTGIFYTMLSLRGEIEPGDHAKFAQAVDACQVLGYPGLFNRNPNRPDFEAFDDYVGIASASFHLSTPHAGDIVDHGKENYWCFDNIHPGHLSVPAWQGRFAGLIGYYRLCAGQPPGWVQNKLLRETLICSMDNADADQRILAWLKIEVLRAKQLNMDIVTEFDRSIEQQYGRLGKLFAQSYGPEHPFSTFN